VLIALCRALCVYVWQISTQNKGSALLHLQQVMMMMCVCVCMCLCVCIYRYIYICVCVCVCVCVSRHPYWIFSLYIYI